MKKLDIILAAIAGEGVALLFIWLLQNSTLNYPLLNWLLPFLFPILAIFAIWLAYLLGKKYLFIYQLTKFLLIGAVFAIFDLIILNILLEFFGISQGEGAKYTLFVATSFIIATTAKYFADKYWAFEKSEKSAMGSEFGKFFLVTLISGIIQTGVASLVFGLAVSSLDSILAGNIGKIAGIAIASAWNFVGYKFFVFKK